MLRGLVQSSTAAAVLLAASQALAQRTDDNAVESAEDAFGKSVGDSAIGIYSESDVRGFSPSTAGNLRIAGLYYDQQGILTGRLQAGSTIRVGISAQSYAFPAPTGIADYALRKPGAEALASVAFHYGPRGGRAVEVDLQLPIDGERLGVAAGAALGRGRRSYGGTPEEFTTALLVRYAPRPGTELAAFVSRFRVTDDEAQPLIFTAGAFLPKRFPRNRFHGQEWNDFAYASTTWGALARTELAGFDARLGVFRSVFDNDASTADLLFGADRDGGVARRVIVRERDDVSASTSGEARLSRSLVEGPRRHALVASLRARRQDRRYGGAAFVELGPSRSDGPDPRANPVTLDGPKTRDRVEQRTWGIAYQGKWAGVGELGVGIQKTGYFKRIAGPDPALAFPDTRDAPWLPSATAALHLTSRLALYAGYTRGLEESPVAPTEAVNRNAAPPAIRTRQADGGVRWAISPGVTAVAGLFEVAKPYFNVDAAGRFRRLGEVTNRGVELSVAGQVAPGLSLVAGNVWIDAKVGGEHVRAGRIGPRPVGSFVRRTLVGVDYRLPGHDRLSIDAALDSTSARTANAANTLAVPPRATLNLGARYRFRLGKAPVLLRVQATNLTNAFGWNVASGGYFTPITARTFALSLAGDF